MRRLATGCAAATLIATVSCGPGVPSEGSGREALTSRIDSGVSSRLKLEKFSKTDGQMAEFGGIRTYRLEYSARVEIVQSVFVTFGEGLSSPGIRSRVLAAADTSGAFSWSKFSGQFVAQGRPLLAGDALTVRGTIAYELKESGWVVSGVEYDATVDTAGRAERRRSERDEAIAALKPLVGPAADTFSLRAGERSGRWAYLLTGDVYFDTTALGFHSIQENVRQGYGNAWLVRVSLSRDGRVALVTPSDPDRGGSEIVVLDAKSGAIRGRTSIETSFPLDWSPTFRWAFGHSSYEGTTAVFLADIVSGNVGLVEIEDIVPLRGDRCGRFDLDSATWIFEDTVRIVGTRFPEGNGCDLPSGTGMSPQIPVDIKLAASRFQTGR